MKRYKIIFIIFSLLTIITLIAYCIVTNVDIKNILGNIFAGLITGIVMSILSNIKNKYIEEKMKKIRKYQELLSDSQKDIITQINLQKKEKISISELLELYSNIYNYYREVNEINSINVKEIIEKIKFKYDILGHRIFDLSNKMMDSDISLNEYRIRYQAELAVSIKNMNLINIEIEKELENIMADTERLLKSII